MGYGKHAFSAFYICLFFMHALTQRKQRRFYLSDEGYRMGCDGMH
jgi:hypothetical protein